MKVPSVRLIFDRYKVSSREVKGLIQIELLFERKRRWISTGVKVYKDQWNERRWVVNCPAAKSLNDCLRKQIEDIESWIADNFSGDVMFTWDRLDEYKERGKAKAANFIDFVEQTIETRNDIRDSTRRAHLKLPSILRQYGRIVHFGDISTSAILDFDNWLHGRKIRKVDNDGVERMVSMRQTSLFDYHKTMKIYITIAVKRGLLGSNPYSGLRFKRGESEADRFLTEDELRTLMTAPMSKGGVARARDMFVFQSFTGISYSDLCEFDFSKVRDAQDGLKIYSGRRVKTGEPFVFVLLPTALEILRKYDYKLPVVSNAGYNSNLKQAAKDAGIDKPIASHWARRTAAVLFANHGVPYEVVAKILGHSNVSTTAQFYARISEKTLLETMRKSGL